jgi:hypothetical protein
MAKFKGRYVVCAEHGVRRETFTGQRALTVHLFTLQYIP